ncbi:MAG: type IV pilus modification PilV family protein [Actinomycetota bacterium]
MGRGRGRWLRARRATSRRGAGDAGVSLIEVLLTVMIMGTAVLAVAGAMGTTFKTSGLTAGRAQAEGEARRVAEHLRGATVPLACSDDDPAVVGTSMPDRYQHYVDQLSPSIPVTVDSVQYLTADVTQGFFDALDCPNPDAVVHRIVVSAATNGGGRATVAFVKRES